MKDGVINVDSSHRQKLGRIPRPNDCLSSLVERQCSGIPDGNNPRPEAAFHYLQPYGYEGWGLYTAAEKLPDAGSKPLMSEFR